MPLKQPVTQKIHTNVAIVRVKLNNKIFEVACYKNKIKNWRAGVETDLDEVLQTPQIFQNVARGRVAKVADVKSCFETDEMEEACKIILNTGTVQVSEGERKEEQESLLKEISAIVVHRLVNPETGTEYPPTIIENSLKESGFSVKLNDTSKKQSLVAINFLCEKFPDHFCRANMSVRIDFGSSDEEKLREFLKTECPEHVEINASSDFIEISCNPSRFRTLDAFVNSLEPKGILKIVKRIDTSARTTQMYVPHRRKSVEVPSSESEAEEAPESKAVDVEEEMRRDESRKSKQLCTKCHVWIERTAYRNHCKTAWHVFNVKRDEGSAKPVSLEEFQEMTAELL